MRAISHVGSRLEMAALWTAASSYLAPISDAATFVSRSYRFRGVRRVDVSASYTRPFAARRGVRVFGRLDNITNQVYFAKVDVEGDTYLLSDVYYLTQAEAGAPSQLLKRGGEPHGPREPMIVPARSVLFIENLRDDSPVVNGIKAFKAGQTSPPAHTDAGAALELLLTMA